MTFSPFFFFVSLFSFSGVFLSFPHSFPHSPSDSVVNQARHSQRSQNRTHSQRSLSLNPLATISPNRLAVAAKSFTVLVAFACSSSLLLAHRRFCLPLSLLPLSLLLAVVAFACLSSLKLDRCRRSSPNDISAPSHTDASASFH